ncbi:MULTISPECIES: putative glycolipid-binding domain-containing protein [Nocardia]|uniref:putative glycolipid-binding domain-containing protein n=1 Tax=Nocardia TaxID=1817 RepID=UPI0002E6D903|nr:MULTISPECIES: putative glycolipid-binding domain-containing protein [Nocardia]MBF6220796.1 putative glycolipid-binding domain-containing protein [Nocardia abscessus]MBF6473823.1 putative glycolipid-binding domain-containing protein [Nocardia abscessus]MCC3328068.1 putative glycolipid-binding domain-containing protein [Nocardia abscessus]MDE1671603.1 putative glycolipid-binding domain-containing protein [Nocardia gipuzkoensis]
MTTPAPDPESPAASTQESRWPAILTWRAHDATRMESVRVQLNGNRIRAAGRMIGGASGEHPAFSASYDLVTDENGVTKRLSLRTTTAAGERHASIARDEENYWLVDAGGNHVRSTFAGALDVDVVLSPFFNTLPIRRYDLQHAVEDVQVPVVYVRLPDLLVQEATLIYSSAADGISVLSPVSSATVTVDADGFLLDYPGLAERI